jgi:hypothetical protein
MDSKTNEILQKFSSHKVDLGKIKLASIKILKDDAKRMQNGIKDLSSLRAKMKKVYFDSIDGANTNRAKFKEKAKELGIDPNDIKEFKDFFDMQRKLDDSYYAPNN